MKKPQGKKEKEGKKRKKNSKDKSILSIQKMIFTNKECS